MELKDIQLRLSQAITTSNRTLLHLSKALNIPLSEIQSYIDKTALPDFINFAKLCILLNKDPAYLLCLDLFTTQEKIDILLYAKAD